MATDLMNSAPVPTDEISAVHAGQGILEMGAAGSESWY